MYIFAFRTIFKSSMQKYFYHKEGQQYGPYSKEELLFFKISRDTMVWCEGLPDWTKAQDVKGLEDLFKNQPPPFKETEKSTPPPVNETRDYSGNNTQQNHSKSKYTWIFWFLAGLFAIGGISYFIYGTNQMKQASMQIEIDEQKEYIRQQEAERQAEEERLAEEARQREIKRIRQQYDNAVVRLRAEYIELEELQEFHFLRTASEKEEQIGTQLSVIRSWENEVQRLKNLLNQY